LEVKNETSATTKAVNPAAIPQTTAIPAMVSPLWFSAP
jgi:hypothetical protein